MPKLFLLGTARIEQDGNAMALTRGKALLLFGYLALHPSAHTRDSLAALFWPDSDQYAARLSLRVTVSELRKLVGAPAFLLGRQTLQFAPDYPLWVDALETQRCAASSRPTDWKAALQWNCAEFLPGCTQTWVAAWRMRLHRARIETLLLLAAHARTVANYSHAVDLARSALALEPANENAHQQVMVCLEGQGQRGAALEQFATCRRTLRRAFDTEPSAATRAIAQRLQTYAATLPQANSLPETNLPVPLTSFVGRATELQALRVLLQPGSTSLPAERLVTLTGAGGSGKTRLSIQSCGELLPFYPDGVWWVGLGALTPGAPLGQVAQEIARVFGVKEVPAEPIETTLLMALRNAQCLLVLDNCEHLVADCAVMAQMIVSWCSQVTMLVSSHTALGVAGECVLSVPNLPLPDVDEVDPQRIAGYAGVRLFVERARAVVPSFRLDAESRAAVLSICYRLDGMPLAIELAVERLKILTAGQIAARLDDWFRLLASGDRAAIPRQKTLTALIDWSYDLLSDTERALLRRVSVFRGGWTVESACAVGTDVPCDWVAVLESLADKSLVIRGTSGAGTYTMLETIRDYAAIKLADAGETAPAFERHFTYFLHFAQRMALRLHGPQQLESVHALDREYDNINAAHAWVLTHACATQKLAFGAALGDFWRAGQHLQHGSDYLLAALPRNAAPDSLLSAQCSVLAGEFLGRQGRAKQALVLLDSARAHYTTTCNLSGLAEADHCIGTIALIRGDLDTAAACYAQATQFAQQAGNGLVLQTTINAVGDIARLRGELDKALALYQQSMGLAEAAADTRLVGIALFNMGMVTARSGDTDASRRYFMRAAAIFSEYRQQHQQIYVLEGFASVDMADGNLQRATSLYAASELLCSDFQFSIYPQDQQQHTHAVLALREKLPTTQFDSAWQFGMGLTLQKALQLAQAPAA